MSQATERVGLYQAVLRRDDSPRTGRAADYQNPFQKPTILIVFQPCASKTIKREGVLLKSRHSSPKVSTRTGETAAKLSKIAIESQLFDICFHRPESSRKLRLPLPLGPPRFCRNSCCPPPSSDFAAPEAQKLRPPYAPSKLENFFRSQETPRSLCPPRTPNARRQKNRCCPPGIPSFVALREVLRNLSEKTWSFLSHFDKGKYWRDV